MNESSKESAGGTATTGLEVPSQRGAAAQAARYAPAPLTGVGTREGEQPAAATVESSEEVTARFLQLLIPAAASVASTFGPQIGSALGGLVGGSSGAQTGSQIGGTVSGILGSIFGGREALAPGLMDHTMEPTDDLTAPMVQQCTLECLGKITPDLAPLMQNWHARTQAGDGGPASAESQIEAMERFWPELSSWVTQQVASNLPDVMKTVTGAVLPLLGTRDAAQFIPILTGTEAHARWFLPVVTSVLTAVQQNLPNLLAVLEGGTRAPRSTGITWTDLAVYGRFWDNDFIRVVRQDNLPNQNSVGLVLELAPHLSWAKEIQVRDDNGALIKRLQVRDATKVSEAELAADQILTNGSLVFAKAKMFGNMTGMYVLPTAGLDELRGKRTHVRWMAD